MIPLIHGIQKGQIHIHKKRRTWGNGDLVLKGLRVPADDEKVLEADGGDD